MRLEISTLKRTVCALVVGLLLFAGAGELALAQRHGHKGHDRGRHLGWTRGRHVGWQRHHNDDRRFRRRAARRERREERRELRRDRKDDRRAFRRSRARGQRVSFYGTPVRRRVRRGWN